MTLGEAYIERVLRARTMVEKLPSPERQLLEAVRGSDTGGLRVGSYLVTEENGRVQIYHEARIPTEQLELPLDMDETN